MDNNGDLLKELRIERGHRGNDDTPGRRRPWVVRGVVVILALVAGGTWWWMQARAINVHTVAAVRPAASDTQGAVLQATGYVTARRMATVSAQIVGTLTSVLIEEGDHVKEGQVLATLEDSAQKARLDAAKANAAAAAAAAHQIQVELAQAKRDMQRQNKLVTPGLVPKQQAEQSRTKVAALKAKLRAQRKQATAAQAQVHLDQVNYNYTIVRAPFAGMITQKTAQVGEIIAPAAAGGGFTRTGVGTIVDMNSLEVDVDVNEAYISRVKPGMSATAVLDAYPDWRIPAHVIAIVPTANKGKATVKVRVALEKKNPRILPDMGVRVSFLDTAPKKTTHAPKGVLVPATAIVERDHQKVVFAIHGSTAKAIHVFPAQQTYGDLKLLPKGVEAGTEVVDKPPQKLTDDMKVKVAGSS